MKTSVAEKEAELSRNQEIFEPLRCLRGEPSGSTGLYSERTNPLQSQRTWRERPNPFCVSQVQPGSVPFFFEPDFLNELTTSDPVEYQRCFYKSIACGLEGRTGIGLLHLANKLEKFGFTSQITGPHGGGKSTLMLELASILQWSNHGVFYYSLHDRQRSFPRKFHEELNSWLNSGSHKEKQIIFLDGFEQLSWWHRAAFRYFCQSRRLGVLLSSHSPVLGIPILYRTSTSRQTLALILDYLLEESEFPIDENRIDALFHRHRGNIRNVLFDLYDEFEQRRVFD